MSALYKITTISDNGNEKSTEWGTWAKTNKDFREFAMIWTAALVMPYGDLPYVHKIIITDKTGNNIYTFIIHPRSAFSSSTLKLTTLNRTKTCKSLKEAAGLFYEGMMKWIDYEFDVKDSGCKDLISQHSQWASNHVVLVKTSLNGAENEGSRGEPVTRVCHVGTREGEWLVLRARVSYLSLIVSFFFYEFRSTTRART